MRRPISRSLASLLALAVLSLPSRAAAAGGPRGLPWPVIVPARHGRFAILPGGRIVRVPPVRPHAVRRLPNGSYYVDRSRGTWVRLRNGHLVVMRGRRRIWRSARSYGFPSANGLSAIAVARAGIAFEVRRTHSLWVAAGRGREHRVASNAWPEMWTTGGRLVTVQGTRRHGYALRLLASNGHLEQTLARHLTTYLLDQRAELPGTRALLFWNAHGRLVRADGSGARVIADAQALGFPDRRPAIYPMAGGLVELLSRRWHEVVLRTDGTVFARASAPADGSVCCFGDQTAAADGSAVAYALTSGNAGATSVYVLHAGDQAGTLVYRVAHGKGYPPTWHGQWLLVVDASGKTVAIDTTGVDQPLDLTRIVARIAKAHGTGRRRPVHWSYAPAPRLRARR